MKKVPRVVGARGGPGSFKVFSIIGSQKPLPFFCMSIKEDFVVTYVQRGRFSSIFSPDPVLESVSEATCSQCRAPHAHAPSSSLLFPSLSSSFSYLIAPSSCPSSPLFSFLFYLPFVSPPRSLSVTATEKNMVVSSPRRLSVVETGRLVKKKKSLFKNFTL